MGVFSEILEFAVTENSGSKPTQSQATSHCRGTQIHKAAAADDSGLANSHDYDKACIKFEGVRGWYSVPPQMLNRLKHEDMNRTRGT